MSSVTPMMGLRLMSVVILVNSITLGLSLQCPKCYGEECNANSIPLETCSTETLSQLPFSNPYENDVDLVFKCIYIKYNDSDGVTNTIRQCITSSARTDVCDMIDPPSFIDISECEVTPVETREPCNILDRPSFIDISDCNVTQIETDEATTMETTTIETDTTLDSDITPIITTEDTTEEETDTTTDTTTDLTTPDDGGASSISLSIASLIIMLVSFMLK